MSLSVQPGSRQRPRGVKELDGVSFGPLANHRFLRDEAMAAGRGALVELILRALAPAARLVVVIGNLSVALRPEGERRGRPLDK